MQKIKNAKKVLEEGNGDKIKEELEVLSKKIEKIGTAMYQQAQQAQQGQQGQQQSEENKRVHDASYEEK